MARKSDQFNYPDADFVIPELEDKRKDIIRDFIMHGSGDDDFRMFTKRMHDVNNDLCLFYRIKRMNEISMPENVT